MKKVQKGSFIVFLLLALAVIPALSTEAADALTSTKFVTIQGFVQTRDQLRDDVTVIDVRSVSSRQRSQQELPEELWINPHDGLATEQFLATADKKKTYIVFCSCPDDGYSIRTAERLTQHGFQSVFVLKGGWNEISKSNVELKSIENTR